MVAKPLAVLRSVVGLLALVSLLPSAALASEEERNKRLDERARNNLGPDFSSLSGVFRVTSQSLPSELAKWKRRQEYRTSLLIDAINITPQNRREEAIAAASARVLGDFRSPQVMVALAQRIDLRDLKHAKAIAMSSERYKGAIQLNYPCVDALVSCGLYATRPVIDVTLTRQEASTAQIELAAYTLLTIHSPQRGKLTEDDRGVLVGLVEGIWRSTHGDYDTLEERRSILVRFVRQVEPRYYRFPPFKEQADEIKPPEGSVLFSYRSRERRSGTKQPVPDP